jgi:hypothetical protein
MEPLLYLDLQGILLALRKESIEGESALLKRRISN